MISTLYDARALYGVPVARPALADFTPMEKSTENVMEPHPGRMLVGCAGWTIPKEAAAAFPLAGSHLERYASVFGAVEINSSFYRPHRVTTYARWAASVADDFRFSVKLPRAITHDARLVGFDEPLAQFAHEAGTLGDKLGCVLVHYQRRSPRKWAPPCPRLQCRPKMKPRLKVTGGQ